MKVIDFQRFMASVGAVVTLTVAAAGCSPKISQIEMDPMEFRAVSTADGVKVELMDAESLFDDGAAAFEAGKFDEAVRLFRLVTERFPGSVVFEPAQFNFGLACLRAGRPGDAAAAFQSYVKDFPEGASIEQARRRLAESLLENGEWAAAEQTIRRTIELESAAGKVKPTTEVELRARLGKALRKQNRFEEARNETATVLEIHDAHSLEPEMKGNYFAAMAAFEAAETWHDLFVSIKFILPTERMEKDLTDKATLFMKAQGDYLRAVRIGNIFWSSKAGVRIAQLYEEFYDDIMTAEVPPGLTEDDLRIYMNELRRQARPLLQKAVDSYERNMAVARMYGAKDEWFTELKSRLERLKSILKRFSDGGDTESGSSAR